MQSTSNANTHHIHPTVSVKPRFISKPAFEVPSIQSGLKTTRSGLTMLDKHTESELEQNLLNTDRKLMKAYQKLQEDSDAIMKRSSVATRHRKKSPTRHKQSVAASRVTNENVAYSLSKGTAVNPRSAKGYLGSLSGNEATSSSDFKSDPESPKPLEIKNTIKSPKPYSPARHPAAAQITQTVDISDALITKMTSLIASRLDPMLHIAQKRFQDAAEQLEAKLTGNINHKNDVRNNDGGYDVKVGGLVGGNAQEEAVVPMNAIHDTESPEIINIPSTPPPPQEQQPEKQTSHRTAFEDMMNKPETIVIEKEHSINLLDKVLLLQPKATTNRKHATQVPTQNELWNLYLPDKTTDKLESSRTRRWNYLRAFMGTAVASSIEYNHTLEGPWDAIER